MSRIYHVHTPVSRLRNIPKFLEMIEMVRTDNVIWHPVFEAHERPALPDAPWIQPMVCGVNPPGYFPGHWKGNWFLDHIAIQDDEYYVQLNDDDFYGVGFFTELDAVSGDVLIASMERGRLADKLYACPQKLHCGGIGGEQIILRGNVQKSFRYGTGYCGDWDMIAAVTAKHTPTFVPDAVVFWNYLERGRWDGVMLPMDYQDESELLDLIASSVWNAKRQNQPIRNVLEIGSMHGDTLAHWMSIATPGQIASIDMLVCNEDPRLYWQKRGHDELWHKWATARGHQFRCFEQNSTDPNTVAAVKAWFKQPLDFLFIDGGHDYATCKADWDNYSPMVRAGGTVAFHDIGAEWPDVRTFWDEIKGGYDHEEFVTSGVRFGIGMLVKR